MTFHPARSPPPPPDRLFELRELDRLAAWLANAAVKRVLDDQRTKRLVLVAAKDIDDERVSPGVIPARAAAAEAARAERRSLAHPAVQPFTLP